MLAAIEKTAGKQLCGNVAAVSHAFPYSGWEYTLPGLQASTSVMTSINLFHAGCRHAVPVEPGTDAETLLLQVFSLTNVPPEQQRLFGLLPSGEPVTAVNAPTLPPLTLSAGQEVALLVPDALPVEGSLARERLAAAACDSILRGASAVPGGRLVVEATRKKPERTSCKQQPAHLPSRVLWRSTHDFRSHGITVLDARWPVWPPLLPADESGDAADGPDAAFFRSYASSWNHSCTRVYFGEDAVLQPCFAATASPGSPQSFVCYACATTCFLPGQVRRRAPPSAFFWKQQFDTGASLALQARPRSTGSAETLYLVSLYYRCRWSACVAPLSLRGTRAAVTLQRLALAAACSAPARQPSVSPAR